VPPEPSVIVAVVLVPLVTALNAAPAETDAFNVKVPPLNVHVMFDEQLIATNPAGLVASTDPPFCSCRISPFGCCGSAVQPAIAFRIARSSPICSSDGSGRGSL